jgi:CzcA family heavy metal efflux pump
LTLGAFSLRHGTALVAALFALALGGIFAARSLPSGVYPEVEFPRIVVVAHGGDDPADVFETQVTRPLEQSLVTVLGVRRVRSRTIRGSAEISLEFVAGTDMWRSLQFVQAQLNNVRSSFPPSLSFEVERLTPTAFPVVTFNLSGPISPSDLHDLAEFVVRPALARVPGVGQVRVLGGDVREVEVVVDPARAAALRLRPTEIANRIRDAVSFGAVGRLDEDRQLLPVLVSGEVHSVEELAAIPIALTPTGVTLPLSSVASVLEGAVDRTTAVGGPGGETVLISVSRAEGASTPDVVRGVKGAALDAAKAFPRGVKLEPVYDQAALVEESAASVRDAILLGVVLCLIVLGISLKDLRAGIVAASAVPLVLASTFVLMKLFHQTLNLMSLGGLAVAIGLVIDDAIIVVEAIMHRLERGEAPEQAAAGGTSDLAAAVFGTTITTVIVFVPLASVAGLVGDFFAALAVTLTSAVLLSLLVALTVVPVFAARWLRRRTGPTTRPALDRFYGSVANWGAQRKWVGPACLALALLSSLALSRVVETGFLPAMDEGAFVLDYFLPAGTSLEQTVATARQIEHVLSDTPEVRSFSRRTGAELGPVTATLLSRGDIMVRLVSKRSRDVEEVMEGLRARLSREVPAARYEFLQVLQDVLNDLSGAPRPIELKFFGADRAVLQRLARDAAGRIEHLEGVADLYDGVEPETPTLLFRVKREAAARLGRSTREVMDEAHSVLAGVSAGTVRRLDRLVDIRVRYADAVRFDPEQVAQLPLIFNTADTGGVVPLGAVVSTERVPVPAVLMREGLQPVIVVTAGIEGRDLGSVMDDVQHALVGLVPPAGDRMEVGGLHAAQLDTFRQLGLVAFFGVLLILLVLIAQFRAVRPALAVLLTVPFALFGALVTLWLTGTPLNASSLMGCVLLVGLEVKSGILLLEVAEEHAAKGVAYVEALRLAAERRIRPIMLTTTATMFGVLPLALGIGAGAELQQPLAIAVFGGIVVSKFMTLAALPSLAAGMHGGRA